MDDIMSPKDYVNTMVIIHRLQRELWQLVVQKGNLNPEVIALSQTLDRYIVRVQTYWKAFA